MSSSGSIDASAAAAAAAVHKAAASAAAAVSLAASSRAAALDGVGGGGGGGGDGDDDDDNEEEEEEAPATSGGGGARKMGRPKPANIVLKFRPEERGRQYWLAVNDLISGDFVKHTVGREEHFKASERVFCIYCKKSIQLVSVAHLRVHADGKKHKSKKTAVQVVEARRARGEMQLGVVRSAAAASALVPHEVGSRARMFVHAMLLAEGLTPAQVTRVMAADVLEMMDCARTFHNGAGIAGVMRSEAQLAERVIIERIAKFFEEQTKYFTLCDDGGSSKLERGKSVHAVLAACAEAEKPILLKMIVLNIDDGTAPKLAKHIKETLSMYKLTEKLATQCVGIMGDNAAITNAVSRELGLGEQQHCLAHAVALLIMGALKRMPNVKKFLLGLHAFFTAGGNKSRRIEAAETVYVEAGVVIGPVLALYLNRWGTVHPLVKALLRDDAKMVRLGLPKFFAEAKSVAAFKASEAAVAEQIVAVKDMPTLAVDNEVAELEMGDDYVVELLADLGGDADGDGDLGEGSPAARKAAIRRSLRVPSAALKAIVGGLADPDLVPELALFDALTESLAPLINAASADFEAERKSDKRSLSCEVVADILNLPDAFAMMKEDPENFMHVAEYRAGLRDATFPEPLRSRLGVMGVAAATLMHNKTKHITAFAVMLKRKLLWDHRCSEFKDHIVPSDKARATASYFGLPEPPSTLWLTGFNKWAGSLKDLTEKQREMSPAAYWRSQATTMPSHYKFGLWYANVLMGNVAAERAIALMRLVEGPLRNRMTQEAWQAEICLRHNKWLVTKEFDDVLADVKTLTAARIQPGSSPAVPAKRPRSAAAADADD
jgi:hypothetical protein